MAAWAERQLAQDSALDVIGPQCARLLSSLVTGKAHARLRPDSSPFDASGALI